MHYITRLSDGIDKNDSLFNQLIIMNHWMGLFQELHVGF